MYSGKKAQHDFPKMRGGDQRPFGTFPKIHHFWRCHPSLRKKPLLVAGRRANNRRQEQLKSVAHFRFLQTFCSTKAREILCYPITMFYGFCTMRPGGNPEYGYEVCSQTKVRNPCSLVKKTKQAMPASIWLSHQMNHA